MPRIIKQISFIVLITFTTTVVLGGSGWGVELRLEKVIPEASSTSGASSTLEAYQKLYSAPATAEITIETVKGIPKYRYGDQSIGTTPEVKGRIEPSAHLKLLKDLWQMSQHNPFLAILIIPFAMVIFTIGGIVTNIGNVAGTFVVNGTSGKQAEQVKSEQPSINEFEYEIRPNMVLVKVVITYGGLVSGQIFHDKEFTSEVNLVSMNDKRVITNDNIRIKILLPDRRFGIKDEFAMIEDNKYKFYLKAPDSSIFVDQEIYKKFKIGYEIYYKDALYSTIYSDVGISYLDPLKLGAVEFPSLIGVKIKTENEGEFESLVYLPKEVIED